LQASELLSSASDSRVAGYQQKLNVIENELMGLSGRRAMALSQRAQVLQEKIMTLKEQEGGGVLSARGRMQQLAKPDFRAISKTRHHWRGRESAEERGSFHEARTHYAFTPTVPLDATKRAKGQGKTAAQILATNLARYRGRHPEHSTGAASSSLHQNAAAFLPKGSAAPPGYIAVRAVPPGGAIPKGAKIVPRQVLAKIAKSQGDVWESVSRPGAEHARDSLMLLDETGSTPGDAGGEGSAEGSAGGEAASEGEGSAEGSSGAAEGGGEAEVEGEGEGEGQPLTTEGNFTMGDENMEIVAPAGRSVAATPPPPPLIGETNMTMSQLIVSHQPPPPRSHDASIPIIMNKAISSFFCALFLPLLSFLHAAQLSRGRRIMPRSWRMTPWT
jgi:hypothetical protein